MRTYGKDTTRIQVRVGERFALELPAFATGGFTWLLKRVPEVAVLTPGADPAWWPASGASSIQEFEFAATRTGTSPLLLEYKRPWENVEGERLEIEIVVEP